MSDPSPWDTEPIPDLLLWDLLFDVDDDGTPRPAPLRVVGQRRPEPDGD